MMYQDKLAVAIKAGGKVLREQKDTVFLPFGTEYTIFIKNLNSVPCLVSISIDGKDIADGDTFIVQANRTIEIERFIRGGNMSQGNRFKFIERTAKVEAHRGGAQVEDGLIRIEYEFEREKIKTYEYQRGLLWPNYVPAPSIPPYNPVWYGSSAPMCTTLGAAASDIPPEGGWREEKTIGGLIGGDYSRAARQQMNMASATRSLTKGYVDDSVAVACAAVNDAGITAPGSVSEQRFVTAKIGDLDGVKHVMVMKLVGEVGEVKVTQPITVAHKQKCETCGHTNKATAKFCSECGAGLTLIK